MTTAKSFTDRDRLLRIPTLYIMVGLPRSGKSTWVNQNHHHLRAAIASGDDVRRALGINRWDRGRQPEVLKILRTMVFAMLLRGQNVIVDETNHTIAQRRRWVHLPCNKRVVYIVVLQPTWEETKRRCAESEFPVEVVRRKLKQFQPVTLSEDGLILEAGKSEVLRSAAFQRSS